MKFLRMKLLFIPFSIPQEIQQISLKFNKIVNAIEIAVAIYFLFLPH